MAVQKPNLICLCGCLAAGKTSFANELFRVGLSDSLLQEDLSEHVLYQELQTGRANWLETQLEFYVRWAQLLCTASSASTVVAVDHSIEVHHEIYSRDAYGSGLINEGQWQALCRAYESVRDFTNARFTIRNVVLNSSVQTLVQRLQDRRRDQGDEFHISFIESHVNTFACWSANAYGALKLSESESALGWSTDTKLLRDIEEFIETGVTKDSK